MVRRVRALGLSAALGVACTPDSSGLGGSAGTAMPAEPSSTSTVAVADETTSTTGPVAPDDTSTTGSSGSTLVDPTTGDVTTTGDTTADSADTDPRPREVEYCAVADLPIPDNDMDGAESSLAVDLPGGGIIVSLRLVVQASHTYVGDLRFDLRKGDAEVLVIDHPGNSGCSGNDIDVVLDDDAFETIDGNCLAEGQGTPAIAGQLQPDNLLDPGFAGQQLVGAWRLRVTDGNDQDVGTLDAWCLRFTYR